MVTITMTEASANRLFWFGFGVFIVAAAQITYRQLETFKARCEITPPRQQDNLDKDIEDAIKLDTLHTLAKGVNYNLARASLRIIAERALSHGPFELLLQQVVSADPTARLQALKTLRFLVCSKVKSENFYENDADYVLTKESYELSLCAPRVYNALVRSLFICLPRNSASFHDKESERYALECLCKLLNHSGTSGIEPKIALYLKHYPVTEEKYDNIVHAFSDLDYERDNYFLHDLYMCVRRTGTGRQMLQEMGMWYDNEEDVNGGSGDATAAENALVAAAAAAAAGIHPDLFRVPAPGVVGVAVGAGAGSAEEVTITGARGGDSTAWSGDAEGEPTLDEAMLGEDGSVSYA